MGAVTAWGEAIGAALDALRGGGPRGSLLKRLSREAEDLGVSGDARVALKHALGDKTNPSRELLLNRFSEWDFAPLPPWSSTERNTRARRDEIYEKLELAGELRDAFEASIPPKLDVDHEVVIAENDAGAWYNAQFLREREFYWPRFRDYLLQKKGLPDDVVQSLNVSSTRILEHLSPPHSKDPAPRRGLVVGYVQSGKTTNFTAVIGKAIDAGFRLIIVFAGTIDLLREQTQRRLDMELVGVENLEVDHEDADREYREDKGWDKFIRFDVDPRALGFPRIRRLTNSKGDFRAVSASFRVLNFEEIDPRDGPAFTEANIRRTGARLLVIKKNTARLKQLIREIRATKNLHNDLPVLVIDDESDQASVNTRAKFHVDKERTKTNAAIVELLRLLPRAQYIGYTATPFANVFVDPNDAEDIFPRDFIISLPRPDGYMGVRDFHDLEESSGGAIGNRQAHVRQFKEVDADEALNRAMDSFLIGGAIKLFRESKGVKGDFKHHTMMIHETVSNEAQGSRRDDIIELWRSAGYASPGRGRRRLELALDEVKRVSLARKSKLPLPENVDELKKYISDAIGRIESDPGPVLVVNGRPESDNPEFDSKYVWKILIGGAKLSRGYTVEGLTVTYFRRRSKQQDSLLQMGRWFGYRGGYKDLVRLYLEESEEGEFDLYTAFEAICRDEEAFRAQLTQYNHDLKPRQVPALVYNSYPQLVPTAKNKMFNAELVSAGFEGFKESGFRSRNGGIEKNWALLEKLVGASLRSLSVERNGQFFWTEVTRKAVVQFLDQFTWSSQYDMGAERRFLRDEKIVASKWRVYLPQLQEDDVIQLGGRDCSIHKRSAEGDDFKAFSDKRRNPIRDAAETERFGALIVYPTQPKDEERLAYPVVGFTVYHPTVDGPMPLVFRARDESAGIWVGPKKARNRSGN